MTPRIACLIYRGRETVDDDCEVYQSSVMRQVFEMLERARFMVLVACHVSPRPLLRTRHDKFCRTLRTSEFETWSAQRCQAE